MTKAKNCDAVIVNYTGRLDDGTIFDSSVGKNPFQFITGFSTPNRPHQNHQKESKFF